jgi:hypothetical protein
MAEEVVMFPVRLKGSQDRVKVKVKMLEGGRRRKVARKKNLVAVAVEVRLVGQQHPERLVLVLRRSRR